MADALDSLEQGALDIWNSFDLNKFISTASQAYVQVKNAGQPASALGAPGTVRMLPDGSTLRINADGSMTITRSTGLVQTIGTNGQLVPGAPGAELIPGIPNVALAIGALGLVALVALRRR